MIRFSALLILLALLTGCGSTPPTATRISPPPSGDASTITPPPFTWNNAAGAILFRIDRQLVGETPIEAMNRIPLCTVYGDGYMTWVTGDQVLEARISVEIIRSFLDFLIRDQRFYSIRDYVPNQLEPTGKYPLELMTLRLNNETRTVRNYYNWQNNEFGAIYERCTRLSAEPVLYQPTGAWLNVQPIAGSQAPRVIWSKTNTALHLDEIAASGKPIWISGSILGYFWTTLRGARAGVQFVEGDKSFQLGLQIPGVSREAPPMPQVTPTMPVVVRTPTPTLGPTSTPAGPRDGAVTFTPVPTNKP